jgi:hypothetical protein
VGPCGLSRRGHERYTAPHITITHRVEEPVPGCGRLPAVPLGGRLGMWRRRTTVDARAGWHVQRVRAGAPSWSRPPSGIPQVNPAEDRPPSPRDPPRNAVGTTVQQAEAAVNWGLTQQMRLSPEECQNRNRRRNRDCLRERDACTQPLIPFLSRSSSRTASASARACSRESARPATAAA